MEEFETITITNQDGKDVEYELVTTIEDDKEWEKVSKILDDLFKDITE